MYCIHNTNNNYNKKNYYTKNFNENMITFLGFQRLWACLIQVNSEVVYENKTG